MSARVLVVEDDADIAALVEINLRLEGFEVALAGDGEEALRAAAECGPLDLVLLDLGLPGMDGLAVCRRLRAEPATAALPIIMITANAGSAEKIAGLTAGADDYILKPFDTLELLARVRSTLRRTAEMRSQSPLTGLPGNARIHAEIAARVSSGEPFAVCYCDLDAFKAFNDAYGFLRGDEAIGMLGAALQQAAAVAGEPVPFVGHVGGDDFLLVCTPEQAEPACEAIIAVVDGAARELHDPQDAARGWMTITDRRGETRQVPLVSVSIGVAVARRRQYRDSREVVAVATEMKGVAKRSAGSSFAVDRRSG